MTINSQIVGSENSLLYTETQLDYAWAAGIMDGEGCTYATQSYNGDGYPEGKPYLRIQIPQAVDGDNDEIPEMLLRFKNIFGGGSISKRKKRKGNVKQQYVYIAVCKQARKILRLTWFRLGEVKKEQAVKAGFKL